MHSGTRTSSLCGSRERPLQLGSVSRRDLLKGAFLGSAAVIMPRGDADALAGGPRRAVLQPQNAGTTLTLVTHRTPSDLDPHSAYDAGSGVVLQGPFEGLIQLKPGTTNAYDAVLADSWSANADKSVWTFQIRKGVTFQDGTLLDAAAARASFERLIALGLAPSTVLGRFIEDPAMIKAPDAHTLVFDLGRPQPLFEAAIASSYGTAIVNVAALRQHDVQGDLGHAWAQTTTEGVGTGPYRVTDFDIETGVVLERFDDYWGGWDGDHFDRIVVRVVTEPETRRALIENGDADIASTLPLATVREMERQPDLIVNHRYNLAVRSFFMNIAGPLESPEARQALCWAFPYDEVITGVYEGFAKRAIGPVAELCRGFAPDTFVYETDLERARALLDVAGISGGTTLSLLLPPGNLEVATTAEVFQANLAAIGVALDLQLVDFATYVGIFAGDLPAEERPNLFPSYWSPDYNDAWNHLWPQVSCDAWQAGNVGYYCNTQVEELLKKARTAFDEMSYLSALREIQHIVTRDDPAAIYYAQPEWLSVQRRDLAGFTASIIVSDLVDFYALHRSEAEGPA